MTAPRAIVFGVAREMATTDELAFFAEADPLGFILFHRNCRTPDQVMALCGELRGSLGRDDVPILIDQEGGRVQRLQAPHWRQAPAAGVLGSLEPAMAERAVWLNARLIAADLMQLGIDVDCVPCLDLARPDTHQAIGDRAFGADPDLVARLGRAQADGLLAGGVLPVIKHLPGHGRATVDSHLSLPEVTATRTELASSDFAPFRALSDLPLGMTAHIVFRDVDPDHPATQSATVIDDVIRREIGFTGLLFSDDLNMAALSGGIDDRARAAIAAGCDVVLHCNGKLNEMVDVASAVGHLGADSLARWQRAALFKSGPQVFDSEAAMAELSTYLPT